MAYIPPHRRNRLPTESVKPNEEVIPSKDTVTEEEIPSISQVPELIRLASIEEPQHKDVWAKERKLFKTLRSVREKHEDREESANFYEWLNHYNDDLIEIYNACIDPTLLISFSQFADLAYRCTLMEVDPITLKYKRPLV